VNIKLHSNIPDKDFWKYSETVHNYFMFSFTEKCDFTATGYGQDDRGLEVQFPVGAGNFSLLHCIQTGSRAHPAPSLLSNGYQG
jgi:hypothetical protein